MPDIFDRVAERMNTAPQGDIFDRVSATPQKAPEGDIFDRVARGMDEAATHPQTAVNGLSGGVTGELTGEMKEYARALERGEAPKPRGMAVPGKEPERIPELRADTREPSVWESVDRFVKDPLGHHEGEMRPADIAEAQIRQEAHDKGLTKEAYQREVYPEGEFYRRADQYGRDVAMGALGTAEGMAGSLDWLTDGAVGKDLANQARLWQMELAPEEQGFGHHVASSGGSMFTFFIPGMGLARGAGAVAKVSPKLAAWAGAGGAGAMEAATEAGLVYENVLRESGDRGRAESAATKTFWLNLPLVAVTNKLGVFSEKGGPLRRGLVSSQVEGGQEAGQEAISAGAEGRPLSVKDALTSYGVGAVTGGGFGAASGMVSPERVEAPGPEGGGAAERTVLDELTEGLFEEQAPAEAKGDIFDRIDLAAQEEELAAGTREAEAARQTPVDEPAPVDLSGYSDEELARIADVDLKAGPREPEKTPTAPLYEADISEERKLRTTSDMPPEGGPPHTSETLGRKLPLDDNITLEAEKGKTGTLNEAKEPWRMTREEFAGEGGDEAGHRAVVRQALDEGKPVPAEVLDNYPDIANAARLEFVRTPDGTTDFGSIPQEVGERIRRQAGPVRLMYGTEKFGARHIEARRKEELKEAGYRDASDLVEDVAGNYTEIWDAGKGRLMLVKRNGRARISVVELAPDEKGDFYNVVTAGVVRKSYPSGGKRKLLWEGRANLSTGAGHPGLSSRTPSGQGPGRTAPSAGDQSNSTDSIPEPSEKDKGKGGPTLSFLGTQEAYEATFRRLRDLQKNNVLEIKNADLSVAQRLYGLPWWTAKEHPEYKAVLDVEINRQEKREHLLHEFITSPTKKRAGETHEYLSLSKRKSEELFRVQLESDAKNVLYQPEELRAKGLDEDQVVAYYAWKRTMDKVRDRIFGQAEELTLKPYENESWYDVLKEVYEGSVSVDEAMGKVAAEEQGAFAKAVERARPVRTTIRELRAEVGRIRYYVPRMRKEGRYVVRVWDGDRLVWSERAGNRISGKQIEKRLRKEHPGKRVEAEAAQGWPETVYQEISDAAIEKFIDRALDKAGTRGEITAEEMESVRDALLEAVTEDLKVRGFGRHTVKRMEGPPVGGYRTTGGRDVFVEYLSGAAGFLTKQKAAYGFRSALEGVDPRKKPNLYEEAAQYVKDMLRNTTRLDRVGGKLRSAAFFWYLAGHLKGAVVQSTQNFITGMPALSRETKGAEYKYTRAMADVLTKRLTKDEAAALHEAFDKGVTMARYVEEAMGKVKGRFGGTFEKMVDILGVPFSGMEVYNRRFAFLAMYRVARTEQGLSHEEAFKKARDFVFDVHFLMGKANLPGWARGGTPAHMVARTSYTFRSYTHNYLMFLRDSIKNTTTGKRSAGVLGRSLAALFLLAGASGIPFLDDLLDILERATGEPYRNRMRAALRKRGGEMLEKFGMEGLPALVGVDISGSVRTGIPFAGLATGELEESVYGVYGGLYDKGRRAIEMAHRGETLRAIENAAPVFVEKPLRAWREYTEGVTSRRSGKPLMDETGLKPMKLTPGEAIAQGLAFRPERAARASKERWTFNNMQRFYSKKRDAIYDRLRMARTKEEQDAAIEEAVRYNNDPHVRNGEVPAITADALRGALRSKPNKRYILHKRALEATR